MKIANQKCEECSVGIAMILFGPPLLICTTITIISILDIIKTHSTVNNPKISKVSGIMSLAINGLIILWYLIDDYLEGIILFAPMLILSIFIINFSYSKRLRNYTPHS